MFALYGYYHGEEGLEKSIELLRLFERVQGLHNPMTILAMERVAYSLDRVGRREESTAKWEELLDLRRRVFGSEHPRTLDVMNNIVIRSSETGRNEDAIRMAEEVLPLSQKSLGPEHVDTLTAMHNLAVLYHEAGRVEEALLMREKLLPLRRKALGSEHTETLSAMRMLAISYVLAERFNEAIALQAEELAIRREVNGLEHPATITAIGNLANMYRAAGLQDKALAMDKEILELQGSVPLQVNSPPPVAVLVPPDSQWRWLHPVDGVDPQETDPDFHRSFFRVDYDDANWKTGKDGEPRIAYLGAILTTEAGGVVAKSLTPDSPGARGGLLSSDLIRTLDGAHIEDHSALVARLATKNSGDQVVMSVLRGGETKELAITLGSRPSQCRLRLRRRVVRGRRHRNASRKRPEQGGLLPASVHHRARAHPPRTPLPAGRRDHHLPRWQGGCA